VSGLSFYSSQKIERPAQAAPTRQGDNFEVEVRCGSTPPAATYYQANSMVCDANRRTSPAAINYFGLSPHQNRHFAVTMQGTLARRQSAPAKLTDGSQVRISTASVATSASQIGSWRS
jgi:hypothetical protein